MVRLGVPVRPLSLSTYHIERLLKLTGLKDVTVRQIKLVCVVSCRERISKNSCDLMQNDILSFFHIFDVQ